MKPMLPRAVMRLISSGLNTLPEGAVMDMRKDSLCGTAPTLPRLGKKKKTAPLWCGLGSLIYPAAERRVDAVGQFLGLGVRGLGIIVFARGKDNARARVDDDAGAFGVGAVVHRQLEIAALLADAGDEDPHIVANDLTDFFELVGVCGADDQRAVAVVVPFIGNTVSDVFIQRATVMA